jgi:heat shock protein HslJ
MNKCRIILLALVVLALVVAGCSSQTGSAPVTAKPVEKPVPDTPPVPPTSPLQPFRGDWALVSMATQGGTYPETLTTAISLSINTTGAGLSGYGGCNNYYAPYTLTGTTTAFGNGITMGPVTSTKKYCLEASGEENTYLGVLQDTTAFAGDESHLTFTGNAHNTLVFNRPGAVPTATSLPRYP